MLRTKLSCACALFYHTMYIYTLHHSQTDSTPEGACSVDFDETVRFNVSFTLEDCNSAKAEERYGWYTIMVMCQTCMNKISFFFL